MSYRGVQRDRIARQQADTIFAQAGQTATWRAYVSSSAGTPLMGLGSAPQYAERTITALFASGVLHQNQVGTVAGQFIEGTFVATTREKLGKHDELRWNGTAYRVDSDPMPARIAGTWVSTIKRGNA